MTTIVSKVFHSCSNPDHFKTSYAVGLGSSVICGSLGSVTACFVKNTSTGILCGTLGGGAIGGIAGVSAVIAYYANCHKGSGGSKTVVDYNGQPSITTRVVSYQPSQDGRGGRFNPDSSFHDEIHPIVSECIDGSHTSANIECSDDGGSVGGGC